MVKKGSFVRIHTIVLKPSERAPQVPDDTKKVPLELWTKGYLQEEAKLGDQVMVKTMTGRLVSGTLIEEHPAYDHNYGSFVPEILQIGETLRAILFGGEEDEH